MSENTQQFETPLPGDEVFKDEASRLMELFVKRFRKSNPAEVPSNIPTACLLQGRKDSEYLSKLPFLNQKTIFFYLESAQCLRRTTALEAAKYFLARKPWEDYDICLFDQSLDWCVGITHNGDIIVAEVNM